MIQRGQVYKCNICGNIVTVLTVGGGQLVCCGQPMVLLTEKSQDVGKEKHLPVIEKNNEKIKIKIGEIPHPMEEAHYIEWVEVITENGSFRKFLTPKSLPEADFEIKEKVLSVRIFCNIHGLWKG